MEVVEDKKAALTKLWRLAGGGQQVRWTGLVDGIYNWIKNQRKNVSEITT